MIYGSVIKDILFMIRIYKFERLFIYFIIIIKDILLLLKICD